MSNRVIVEGGRPQVTGQAGPERLEISTFVRDIRQFSLYVQALGEIYTVDRNNPRSFWQVAGIHGQPIMDYDGISSGGRFFCAHSSEIFPTWHRSYVVLLEQEIQRIAREIASRYTYERPQWEAAAVSLRQPYWGWDNRATFVLPDQIILSNFVMIRRPENPDIVAVPNPFLAFTYPAGANAALSSPFNRWPRTVRYPDSAGNSQPHRLLAALQSPVEADEIVGNTERLYSLTTWYTFTFGSPGTTGLEGIHNTIHNLTGGSGPGNMATVEAAAFDPIFWLHHAQVDRVIDLWQRIRRVWTNNASNLLPFRRTQTDLWQSPQMAVGTSSTFNYSYEGPINRTALGSRVIEGSEASEITEADTSSETIYVALEWSIRVQCKEFELEGSFSVYIFLSNQVPPDHREWLFHPSFAGTFDVFANGHPEQCANCSAHSESLIKGFVHINKQLLERSGHTSFDPAVVLPYLKENLSWGVVKVNGELVDLTTFPSLSVTVLCMPLNYPSNSDYPVEGEPTVYPDITRGRPGGDHSA